jgi:dihydrofolate synthase/folylpolyglutamate synthase
MSFTSYVEALNWLYQQFPSYQKLGKLAYKPDLGNIDELLSELNRPEKELKFIHVAGTNGKGSVCSMLASILKESGYKTGLFTSPHITDFRERIRINGEMISAHFVVDFCNIVQQNNKLNKLEPSFFEITFAMALQYFSNENCDICIIETGLGGRLDATNIINPALSIITNISFDHTDLLGDTLEAIAFEKAGIIKRNIPVIIGEAKKETLEVFKLQSKKMESTLILTSNDTKSDFNLPFLADYQKQNFNVVLTAISELQKLGYVICSEHIQKGLTNLSSNSGFIARMQVIQENPTIIVDVSHNEAGIKETLSTISKIYQGKLHLIFGASADKDHTAIINLFPKDVNLSFSLFSNPRGWSKKLAEQIAEQQAIKPIVFENIELALAYHKSICNSDDTILIFGSFFLLSDFFDFFPK